MKMPTTVRQDLLRSLDNEGRLVRLYRERAIVARAAGYQNVALLYEKFLKESSDRITQLSNIRMDIPRML